VNHGRSSYSTYDIIVCLTGRETDTIQNPAGEFFFAPNQFFSYVCHIGVLSFSRRLVTILRLSQNNGTICDTAVTPTWKRQTGRSVADFACRIGTTTTNVSASTALISSHVSRNRAQISRYVATRILNGCSTATADYAFNHAILCGAASLSFHRSQPMKIVRFAWTRGLPLSCASADTWCAPSVTSQLHSTTPQHKR